MNEVAEKYMNMEGSRSVESLSHMRLRALLTDVVREEGRMEAAKLLGVNYKTLVRAIESDGLSPRMKDALERLLLTGGVPAEQRRNERIDGLEQTLQGLGERVESLEEGLRRGLDEMRTAVENEVNALREEQAQGVNGSGRTAIHKVVRTPGQRGGRPPHCPKLRVYVSQQEDGRDEPLVLAEMPEPDDEEFYGPVWPVIAEWRALRSGHPNRGNGLSWLVDEERLMEVEVALLEEHGFTLPPETEELRGFARSGQLDWRKRALHDTRRARIKRERLRWVRRVLTLGLWWK